MLKKEITYKTFDDESITETFHFNLSKADLIDLQMSHEGGLQDYLERIVAAEDGPKIMEEFKNILRLSYGKKSEDGKRFVKSDELWQEFRDSNAYSELLMALVTDAGEASAFIAGVVPQDLSEAVAKIPQPVESPAEPLLLTPAEAAEMDGDELQSGLATGRYRISQGM